MIKLVVILVINWFSVGTEWVGSEAVVPRQMRFDMFMSVVAMNWFSVRSAWTARLLIEV